MSQIRMSQTKMSQMVFNNVRWEYPADWSDQGMITLTLPSDDRSVKPNIIVTKETIPQPVPLLVYFEKIKMSILNRGIRDFEILNEDQVAIGGVEGMRMVCRWNISAMKQMLAAQKSGDEPIPEIKPNQVVRQLQLTLLKGQLAVNLTGSFPDDQFARYEPMFDAFVQSIRID